MLNGYRFHTASNDSLRDYSLEIRCPVLSLPSYIMDIFDKHPGLTSPESKTLGFRWSLRKWSAIRYYSVNNIYKAWRNLAHAKESQSLDSRSSTRVDNFLQTGDVKGTKFVQITPKLENGKVVHISLQKNRTGDKSIEHNTHIHICILNTNKKNGYT